MTRIEDAIGLHSSRKSSCGEAADLLGCSERHFLRFRHAYAEARTRRHATAARTKTPGSELPGV